MIRSSAAGKPSATSSRSSPVSSLPLCTETSDSKCSTSTSWRTCSKECVPSLSRLHRQSSTLAATLTLYLQQPPLMSRRGHLLWIPLVVVYWGLAFVIGSAIPSVGTLSGLVAATCIFQFTYTFPPALYLGYLMKVDAMNLDEPFSQPGIAPRQHDTWRSFVSALECHKSAIGTDFTLLVHSLAGSVERSTEDASGLCLSRCYSCGSSLRWRRRDWACGRVCLTSIAHKVCSSTEADLTFPSSL